MFPISSASLTTPDSVTPLAESAAVTAVHPNQVAAAGSATDAPPAASVTIELSPVASFLLTVSQSQEQLAQLQTAVANGAEPREAAATLNDTTQNVVNAFNLLPAVDFNQAQLQGPSLLNQLVQSLQQQTFGNHATQPQQTAARSLAQIGVTLQAPLLSDASGGLSLDNEVLRASFNTDQQNTTRTLQNTLNTFSELATHFVEQLSAAGTGAVEALTARQQASLTPADVAAKAPPSPLVNPQQAGSQDQAQASTQASAQAADAAAASQAARQQSSSDLSAATAASTQAVAQAAIARNAAALAAAAGATNAANTTAAQQATAEQDAAANLAAANQAAASAVAQALAAQAAADALAAQSAAASAAAQQALAAQIAATTPEAANAAAAVVAQQASAAQATAANLAAANAAAATAAQQASAAQSAAAQAQTEQNAAAQVATVQASTLQNDPLRANPALAAAIAAYNINDTGANAHTAQAATDAIPRVPAVEAAARSRALGNAP